MSYISVNVDVDIDDIIDSMSRRDKENLLRYLSDNDLLEEVKSRNLKPRKGIEVNKFILESNSKKREYLIRLFDLHSHSTDEQILTVIKENI